MLTLLPGVTSVAIGLLQLTSAQVAVQLGSGDATVQASYALAAAPDSIRFVLARTKDQAIVLRESPPGTRVRALPGLYEIVVTPDKSQTTVRLRYRVAGNVKRIPVPVPDVAAVPGIRTIAIDVTGLPGRSDLDAGFPRLSWVEGGVARARLENLPSLLDLPPLPGEWSFGKIADILVVGLVVSASALWWWWRRLAAHNPG